MRKMRALNRSDSVTLLLVWICNVLAAMALLMLLACLWPRSVVSVHPDFTVDIIAVTGEEDSQHNQHYLSVTAAAWWVDQPPNGHDVRLDFWISDWSEDQYGRMLWFPMQSSVTSPVDVGSTLGSADWWFDDSVHEYPVIVELFLVVDPNDPLQDILLAQDQTTIVVLDLEEFPGP